VKRKGGFEESTQKKGGSKEAVVVVDSFFLIWANKRQWGVSVRDKTFNQAGKREISWGIYRKLKRKDGGLGDRFWGWEKSLTTILPMSLGYSGLVEEGEELDRISERERWSGCGQA